MNEKFEAQITPPSSPRTQEEQRLRTLANGSIFAPTKGDSADARRNQNIEKFVQDGLEKFDESKADEDSLIFPMDL